MKAEWAQGEGRGGEEGRGEGRGGRERRGRLLAIYPLSLRPFNYILSPPQLDIIFCFSDEEDGVQKDKVGHSKGGRRCWSWELDSHAMTS